MLSLLFLALSGGILPPVMLPRALREMMTLSPITWLRGLLAVPAGYTWSDGWIPLVASTALMLAVCLLLFRRRLIQEVQRL